MIRIWTGTRITDQISSNADLLPGRPALRIVRIRDKRLTLGIFDRNEMVFFIIGKCLGQTRRELRGAGFGDFQKIVSFGIIGEAHRAVVEINDG